MTVLLTHGAGSNRDAPLLVAIDQALSSAGIMVVRYNLPFRQNRTGPPGRGDAVKDRVGLASEVRTIRDQGASKLILAGHSYGGRQSSILASEDPAIADGLLLLSYPLHPPRKPEELRTAHLPAIRTKSLFIHGTRDPFGSITELESAISLISAETRLVPIEGAGHELKGAAIPALIASSFLSFFA